jgi:hypothetical protein
MEYLDVPRRRSGNRKTYVCVTAMPSNSIFDFD